MPALATHHFPTPAPCRPLRLPGPARRGAALTGARVAVAPRADILSAMLQRQRELQSSGLYQRASTCLLLTPARVRRQVGLQVVREYGLPDCMVRVLQVSVGS